MSRGYPVEQWAEWIAQHRGSGLTVAAFCDSIGVSQNAFYVRRRQLADQMQSSSPAFVSLNVSDHSSLTASVEVELPCGAIVRVTEQDAVRTVVAELIRHGAAQ